MKYFKHRCGSGDNPSIGEAVELFGTDAYYVFFRTLEIMAKNFDIENPGVSNFNYKWFLKRFQKSFKRKTIESIFDFFNQNGDLTYMVNGEDIVIKSDDIRREYENKRIIKLNNNRQAIPKEVRRAVINRDNKKCQYCEKEATHISSDGATVYIEEGCVGVRENDENNNFIPFEIDHIVPISAGGSNDTENLALSCRQCNRGKGVKIL